MALKTLKELWKNDYFQMVLMIALMALIVFGFWYGAQMVMHTEYPALAVVSNSMQPILNIGDIIIVQGISADQIHANYIDGDIVVFKDSKNPDFRVVHRAIRTVQFPNGSWTITTHGDNNPMGANENFSEKELIGKVVAKIPYVGNFSLFVNKLGNFYLFILIIIIVISILLSLFVGDEEKESIEKKKLFGKITVETIVFTILNILLISLILFSLFGSFTFYQIGAEPYPQYVTIRGIYTDLQYYTSFQTSYNHIYNASFSQGFLTYTINCYVSNGIQEGIRPGVPAFSWFQTFFLILFVYDVWKIAKFLRLNEKLGICSKPKTQPKPL